MSSMPFAMYQADSVHKMVRAKLEQENEPEGHKRCPKEDDRGAKVPIEGNMYKYNLKFMNSIWGMYNRYAPQAFQKNYEAAQRLH